MAANKLRMLVVEDDENTAAFIATVLEREGWEPVTAGSAAEAAERLRDAKFNLALIDLHLPEVSGWDFLKALKADAKTASMPCFLMSARYVQDEDVCRGLYQGADDYLVKPISREVMVAKIKAHLRRSGQAAPFSEAVYFKRGQHGTLTLHPPTRSVSLHHPACAAYMQHRRCGGESCKETSLTKTEFDLLAFFVTSRTTRVLSRREILEGVWDEASLSVSQDVVDKHVESLRKKLKKMGGMIKTVYGVGYTFEEDSDA